MSGPANDGGQAFPHGNPTHGGDTGMSLRDWFAGQATEQDVQNHIGESVTHLSGATYRNTTRTREEAKYAYADAMLAARAKKEAA